MKVCNDCWARRLRLARYAFAEDPVAEVGEVDKEGSGEVDKEGSGPLSCEVDKEGSGPLACREVD